MCQHRSVTQFPSLRPMPPTWRLQNCVSKLRAAGLQVARLHGCTLCGRRLQGCRRQRCKAASPKAAEEKSAVHLSRASHCNEQHLGYVQFTNPKIEGCMFGDRGPSRGGGGGCQTPRPPHPNQKPWAHHKPSVCGFAKRGL
jgi:hypothetical protein